jgi:ribosomal protein S18 acetylase RimI-like enzyme
MLGNIKRASLKDAEALAKLVNSAYRGESSKQGWTTEADLLDGSRIDPETIVSHMENPDTLILKYVAANKILGCVELNRINNALYLGMLTVQPDLQGKGIGKELLKAAEVEATEQKCNCIFMTVISVRSTLIDFYVRHGYEDTGKRKPFDFNDPRFGIPKQKLEFVVLEKKI